jgi:hypothetical protein
MRSPKFYTYLLIDPRTGLPFYIGKGSGKRMYHHETGIRHNPYLRERIAELRSLDLKIVYEKWFESDDKDFCYWVESYLIDYFGRENLCNLTRGGGDALSGEDHPCKDPKVRARLSNSGKALGERHPCKRPEIRLQIGRSGLGRTPWNKGKNFPGVTNTGSFRKGMPAPMKGKRHTEVSRKKMSETRKGQKWVNKEGISKQIPLSNLPALLNDHWRLGRS